MTEPEERGVGVDLGSHLERARTAETAQAIRALLASPLLSVGAAPETFALVRAHRDRLTNWFDANTGWQLVVEPRQGYARLMKITDRPDAMRPALRTRGTHAPFDRHRYALLCVVAAELVSGQVTTIGILADRVRQVTALDPRLESFEGARYEHRRAYVDALLLLESFGVLAATDGATESYLSGADAKVLYRVDATRLARLLSAPQSPSRLGGHSEATETPGGEPPPPDPPSLAELVVEPRYGAAADPGAEVAAEARNLWLRHTIVRRLLDDPVVYRTDLTEAQRGYLASPTGRRVVRRALAEAGLALEERAEGMLAVDPDALATDERFPADGSVVKQTGLLLLDALLSAHPEPMAERELAGVVRSRMSDTPNWAKTYRGDETGPVALTGDAVDVLVRFGLAEREHETVRALPAAARYSIGQVTVRATGDQRKDDQ